MVVKVEINNKEKIQPVYLIKPIITHLLSRQTKEIFLKEVNRDSVHDKLSSLVKETDYFIFEMLCNYLSSDSSFYNFIQSIDFVILELINYLFVIAHQIFLMKYFNEIDDNNIVDLRYKIHYDKFILGVIQTI
jgi:hypothetical protein